LSQWPIGQVFGLIVLAIALPAGLSQWAVAAETPGVPGRKVDFSREIRPILANHCWSCHGPDEQHRKAGLRLDGSDAARAKLESGLVAIVAGKPGESELVVRIESDDESEVMPPPASKKPLTAEQKKLLKLWIEQGAEFAQHWAFVSPQRSAVPAVNNKAWPRNSIDYFVLQRLEAAGMIPAPEADKGTLLRRVSLDLVGLPPTLAELEAFLADNSSDAYEKVVDRLLDSPRYGEKLAMQWLDAARYADTNGYNNDEERSMWPWRDWVIRAFNSNMPFDRFVTEQLAGDLLKDPTLEQRIATGFNRNHVLTTEGGIIDEEYRVEYVADRVHTTATVLMGLSLQCARCHDHKFDPISQREYYQFFSFFNSVADKSVDYNQGGVAEPYLKAPSAAQQEEMAGLAAQMQALGKRLADRRGQIDEKIAHWEQMLSAEQKQQISLAGQTLRVSLDETEGDRVQVQDAVPTSDAAPGQVHGMATWKPGKSGNALSFEGTTFVDLGPRGVFDWHDAVSLGAWVFPTSNDAMAILSKIDDAQAYRGFDLLLEGGKPAVHLIHHWPDNGLKVIAKKPVSLMAWHHVLVTSDGSGKGAGVAIYVDGQPQELDITNDNLGDTIKTDQPLRIGRRSASNPFRGLIDDVQFFGAHLTAEDARRIAEGTDPVGLGEVLAVAPDQRTPEQREKLRRYYLDAIDADYRAAKTELAEANRLHKEVDAAAPRTMVMAEIPEPRIAHILIRGQYDQPGDEVKTEVPAVLSSLPADAPRNRLGLAQWLTSPSHPLTARVAVNRFWGIYFGTGLVETAEDFGVQGEPPSHPELLDWLAMEFAAGSQSSATPGSPPFARGGIWNIKALQKLIVTSATYRQSSNASPASIERDPKNRLLARGPRFRLPAETVRDCALAIGGLLREKLGGPSVKPYQPAGLWEDVSVERRAKYVADKNDGLYRRSMYTFWKRTCPPPGMTAFDAPDRETCLIRRARTNTPLQALVLLNDPTYVESARTFAERLIKEAGPTPAERITHAYRLAMSRPPTASEQRILQGLYQEAIDGFRRDKSAAEKLVAVGDSPRDTSVDVVELAGWTTIASVLLNLDETISKE
jgi:mono/diheme cytochrome c family protein